MTRILFVFMLVACAALGAARRAVIVGINQYRPKTTDAPAQKSVVVEDSPRVQRPAVLGRGGARAWTDLDGSYNDAALMRQYLIDRLGFRAEDIIFLTDAEHSGGDPRRLATAQNILDTFRKHLIDAAQPGDVSFFFYAGHGSRILNKKTEEPDGLDETLVPADAANGAPDIRDKELARLYRAAVRKGAILTVVLDSCHSGGAARGIGAPGKTRDLPKDTRFVEDGPDLDPSTGRPLPDPTAEGALVIAAAQDDQAAREVNMDGEAHGAFTWYFVRALQTSSINESVERLFARTQAMMTAGNQMQLPSLNTNSERASRGLFGQPADSTRGLVVPLLEVRSNGTVLVRGGRALGLDAGCELIPAKALPDKTKDAGVRLRITGSNLTLSQAEAKIVSNPGSVSLQAGDEFVLDKWVLPPSAATAFYLPSSGLPSQASLQMQAAALATDLGKHGVKLAEEPTVDSPDAILRWTGGTWQLEIRKPAGVRVADLGSSPAAAAIAQQVGTDCKLFIDLPPSAELAASVVQAVGQQTATLLRNERANTIYEMVGRWKDGRIEYAWVLSGATREDVKNSPLPDRTKWVDGTDAQAGRVLQDLSSRITRVRLWLQMDAPGASDSFPYEMVLRNVATHATKTSGTTIEGERYEVFFRSQSMPAAGEVTPKWIYIATIDSAGKMQRLFPRSGSGNTSESRLPSSATPVQEFRIPVPIDIQPEFGVDTLIAIITDEPIDTTVLYSEGVRSARGEATPLENFLMSVQGARGQGAAVSGFSVQRLTTRSVSREEAAKETAGPK